MKSKLLSNIFEKNRLFIMAIFTIGFILTFLFCNNMMFLKTILEGNINYLVSELNYDSYMSVSFGYGSTILPIIVSSFVISFVHEIKELLAKATLYKTLNYRTIIILLFKHASLGALSLYIAYIFYCILGLVFGQDENTSRVAFDFLLGVNFAQSNIFLYFIIEGFIKYFLFTFIYCLFSCSIALVAKKLVFTVIIPIVYYFGFSIIFGAILDIQILTPSYIHGFSSYMQALKISGIIIPLLVPISFTIINCVIFSRKRLK